MQIINRLLVAGVALSLVAGLLTACGGKEYGGLSPCFSSLAFAQSSAVVVAFPSWRGVPPHHLCREIANICSLSPCETESEQIFLLPLAPHLRRENKYLFSLSLSPSETGGQGSCRCRKALPPCFSAVSSSVLVEHKIEQTIPKTTSDNNQTNKTNKRKSPSSLPPRAVDRHNT